MNIQNPAAIKSFSEFSYQRPDVNLFKETFSEMLRDFKAAKTLDQQVNALKTINQARKEFLTDSQLVSIRHSIDTNDQFYEQEKSFFDEHLPAFEALSTQLYEALLDSPFQEELQGVFGEQLFRIARLKVKVVQPSILPQLQRENHLRTSYIKVKAKSKIKLDGKVYNLSSIKQLERSTDRSVRKKAATAKWQFFAEQAEEIEGIYHQLVQTRHEIAQTLGYDNFIQFGYDRLLRTDYDASSIAVFREAILKYITPLATRLRATQSKHLGLDPLYYYDEDLIFAGGNPQPSGDTNQVIQQAAALYKNLSTQTDTFFAFLRESGLMDLENRSGKAPGGYCTFLPRYGAPFIFSNFNGTSSDVEVLTHEAGHAFQVYCSRRQAVPEYYFPTYEAAEIHSMSMEFWAWSGLSHFFGEHTTAYKWEHLFRVITFLPYCAAIDEFQHFVYALPDCSIEERRQAWKEVEAKYLPHRKYEADAFAAKGVIWIQQSHLFVKPFYYIDYGLAQICALQFWEKIQQKDPEAWQDYLRVCEAGGSLSFLELVDLANLQSPFDHQLIKRLTQSVQSWLKTTSAQLFG